MKFLTSAAALLLFPGAAALASIMPTPLPDHPIPADPPAAEVATIPVKSSGTDYLNFLHRDPDAYSIISVTRGLSTHRPMYVMPLSYSPGYNGKNTEVVFQLSAKQRVLNSNFYFAYTQTSFWQLYDKSQSSPFRETDYNPEIFYRWIPQQAWLNHWGADVGFEHASNGKGIPDSRSWNRLYVAPFQAKGKYLAYLKFWYRVPEKDKTGPQDGQGDDNPDIEKYYGYGEFQFQRQFGAGQLAWVMARINPASGKGAIALNYSVPNSDDSLIYCINLFQGYGESLIDYNHSVTRLAIGVMFSR